MALGPAVVLVVLLAAVACPPPALAGAGFTIGGRPVTARETNFAGLRHASPTHQVVVQVNHGDVHPSPIGS